MKALFSTIAVVAALLMILCILLQSRGQSLGMTWGGGDTNFYRSKRGAEKILFNGTIVLAIIFVLSVLLGILSNN